MPGAAARCASDGRSVHHTSTFCAPTPALASAPAGTNVNAPGYGSVTARTRFRTSRADQRHSMRPSAGVRRPNLVALDSIWTMRGAVPSIAASALRSSTVSAAFRTLR